MREQTTEEWRPVVGWEGSYSVSNLGRVRRERAGRSTRIGRVLTPIPHANGYQCVTLFDHGRQKTALIHTSIAAAFIGPRPPGLQINHKDGVKTNNAAENLEYCTSSENIRHSYRLGLSKPRPGELSGNAKLTERDVLVIRSAGGTHVEIARRFGVCRQTISDIKARRTWKHVNAH